MKAVVYDAYGPPSVLRIENVAKPTLSQGKVLIKVYATGLSPYDWRFMRADPFLVRMHSGLLKPKRRTLGLDFAGKVEAIGCGVQGVQIGDSVFGLSPEALAEFVCANENQIVKMPSGLSFEQASVVTSPAITALQSLRDHGRLVPGETVLINGASGGVGTFVIQIAKSLGAEVTGVCSGRNIELVRSIGCDHALSYDTSDITENATKYDLIIDAVGNHSLKEFKQMLRPSGRFVAVAGPLKRLVWLALPGRSRMLSMMGRPNPGDLAFIKELLLSGTLVPVIDRVYPLENVSDAIAYLETGRVRGKVAVRIAKQ